MKEIRLALMISLKNLHYTSYVNDPSHSYSRHDGLTSVVVVIIHSTNLEVGCYSVIQQRRLQWGISGTEAPTGGR